MNDHLFTNRNSTINIKNLISLGKTSPLDSDKVTSSIQLANMIFHNIECPFWINHCVMNPYNSQGTAYLLLSIYETVNSISKPDIKKKYLEKVFLNKNFLFIN